MTVSDIDQPWGQCQDCQHQFSEDALEPVDDVSQRVLAGEPMPLGQCPDCAALVEVMERTTFDIPVKVTAADYEQARHIVEALAEMAQPRVPAYVTVEV